VVVGHGLAFGVKDVVRLAIGVPIWVLFAYGHNLYYVESRRADHGLAEEIGPLVQMTTLWTWSMVLVAAALGLTPSVELSELVTFWVVALICMAGLRALVRAWSRRRSWYPENALVVGSPSRGMATVRKIQRHPEYGINVVACVNPSEALPEESPEVVHAGRFVRIPVLHGDQELFQLIEEFDVDRIIVAWWPDSSHERLELIDGLSAYDIHVDVVPSWFELLGSKLELHEMEGTPLLRVPSRKLGRSSLRLKRCFDLVVSCAAVLLLAPLFALCAVCIKFDDKGPILFRQRRVGKDGRAFDLLKFRSMRSGADELKADVATLNLHGGANGNGMFKIRDDPRVTRIGAWLRSTSLDELPQLINVIRGDMSLVGARPLIEEEDRQIQGRFRRRLSLTPGLTGLWQVHGRSDIPFETMVQLDHLYATSWTLWGDVKILIRTASAVMSRKGAY
jgi:exopolysaccharide biosynthesis polyprenyl glycosylphosphotransferase